MAPGDYFPPEYRAGSQPPFLIPTKDGMLAPAPNGRLDIPGAVGPATPASASAAIMAGAHPTVDGAHPMAGPHTPEMQSFGGVLPRSLNPSVGVAPWMPPMDPQVAARVARDDPLARLNLTQLGVASNFFDSVMPGSNPPTNQL